MNDGKNNNRIIDVTKSKTKKKNRRAIQINKQKIEQVYLVRHNRFL